MPLEGVYTHKCLLVICYPSLPALLSLVGLNLLSIAANDPSSPQSIGQDGIKKIEIIWHHIHMEGGERNGEGRGVQDLRW